jgi:hypothetical protein
MRHPRPLPQHARHSRRIIRAYSCCRQERWDRLQRPPDWPAATSAIWPIFPCLLQPCRCPLEHAGDTRSLESAQHNEKKTKSHRLVSLQSCLDWLSLAAFIKSTCKDDSDLTGRSPVRQPLSVLILISTPTRLMHASLSCSPANIASSCGVHPRLGGCAAHHGTG